MCWDRILGPDTGHQVLGLRFRPVRPAAAQMAQPFHSIGELARKRKNPWAPENPEM